MKNKDIYWRRYKKQKTLYIGQSHLRPLQSTHFGASHSSPSISFIAQNTLQNPLLELPSAAPSYSPESQQWSDISSLSKVIIVLRKARRHRAPNLGCQRGWITWVIWCFAKNLCTRQDAWVGMLLWWKSPVAQSCGRFHSTAYPNHENHGGSTPR